MYNTKNFKEMKKLLLLLVAAFTMSSVAMAQGPGQMDPEQMAKFMTERMVEQYGLDEAQQAKITAANLEFAKGMFSEQVDFMSMGDEERQAFMQKMQKLGEARDKKFKEILTKEQYEKYVKEQEEMRSRGFGG